MHGGPASLGDDRAASRTSRRSCQSALRTRCYPQILLKTHLLNAAGSAIGRAFLLLIRRFPQQVYRGWAVFVTRFSGVHFSRYGRRQGLCRFPSQGRGRLRVIRPVRDPNSRS